MSDRMINPSIDQLLGQVDSKYTLVVASARRARMLTIERDPRVELNHANPVSIALEELVNGELFYEHTRGDRGV